MEEATRFEEVKRQLENHKEVTSNVELENLVKKEIHDKQQLQLKILPTHLKYVF